MSAAVQMHDSPKNWYVWGNFQEQMFLRDSSNMEVGASAIVCYIHAAIHITDPKSRRPLSKVSIPKII